MSTLVHSWGVVNMELENAPAGLDNPELEQIWQYGCFSCDEDVTCPTCIEALAQLVEVELHTNWNLHHRMHLKLNLPRHGSPRKN